MKKPKPKKLELLDWSECTRFIEKKHKCDTRDFARAHHQFGEWCRENGAPVISCSDDVKGSQKQYARFNADIAAGKVVERPYQDFWHFLCDAAQPTRGGQLELSADMAEGAEPWVKQILGWYLEEFGPGPYLTDW